MIPTPLTEPASSPNHRLLQAVADFVGDALFVKDIAGRYLLLNSAGAAMLGRPPAEVVGKTDYDIFPHELVPAILEVDRAVMSSGEPQTTPEVFAGPGPVRYLMTTKAPYRDADGKIIGVMGIARDVTASRVAEQALRSSEQRLSLAMQAGGMGTCEMEAGTFDRMIWSDQTFQLLGYSPSSDGSATLEMWLDRIHSDDRGKFEAARERLLRENVGFAIEFRIARADDGRAAWLSLIARPCVLADGHQRSIGIVQDVTAHKKASEEITRLNRDLQQRVAELQTLLEVLPVGIGIARDTACARIDVNPFFAELLSIPPKSNASLSAPAGERPKNFSLWMQGRPLEMSELPLQKVVREGISIRNLEVQMRMDDGRIIDLLEFAVPLFDESGKTRGAVGVFVDMTEVNRAKDQARRQHDELIHLARFVTMGEMASGLAHELNQPLGAIHNYAAAASLVLGENARGLDEKSVERVRLLLDDVEGEVRRAGEIIRRLRAFVRKQEPRRMPLDLVTVVQGAMQLLVFEMRRSSVRFVLHADPSISAVIADRVQVEQVLVNLIRNAIEAMESTDLAARILEIRIAAENETRMCRVSVRDHGEGIDDTHRHRIFDSFFTTKPEGMGIGLTISRSIIESHGGRLACSAIEGPGAEFSFTLPMALERDDEETR